MKLKVLGLLFSIILIAGCKGEDTMLPYKENMPKTQEPLLGEAFIQKNLLEADGRMRTNITNQQNNYLSEKVGLWLSTSYRDNQRAKNDENQWIICYE